MRLPIQELLFYKLGTIFKMYIYLYKVHIHIYRYSAHTRSRAFGSQRPFRLYVMLIDDQQFPLSGNRQRYLFQFIFFCV